MRRNADAKAGDVLVLGKPIGVGVLCAALRKNALDADGCRRLIASGRNWTGYGHEVELDAALPIEARDLLTDPQTSGGLLVSCEASAAASIIALFRADGFASAAAIGSVSNGPAGLRIAP